MKDTIRRIAMLLLLVVMLIQSMTPAVAHAQRDAHVTEEIMDGGGSIESPKVLLIQDVLPWDSNANEEVLKGLTEYDKVTTSGFLDVNLEEYGVVVFANDQPFSSYNNYTEFKEYLELFASIGGVIVFGACDAGWADGELVEDLPGNVKKTNHYEYYNYVADSTHPIVTGELTDNVVLLTEDLQSSYCSHISFDESSLPAGAKVILRESGSNKPTLIEYPLGKGRVIASGLTWEHNYTRGGDTISGIEVGYFAKNSMDDMLAYAIRVSSIDVEELELLEQWKVQRTFHGIIAADGENIANLEPIEGALVDIDGDQYFTTENGQVLYSEYGNKTVAVSAEGYREYIMKYNLEPETSRIFFLEKQKDDGLPYLTQVTGAVSGTTNYLDLRNQIMHFNQNDKKGLIIYLNGNWNGHGEGHFVIYQKPSMENKGKFFEARAGVTTVFSPGLVFDANRDVWIQMVAGDGTASEPVKLNLYIDPEIKVDTSQNGAEGMLQEGIIKFDWIGNHAVASDNEIFMKLFTADMSLASDLIPIEISAEYNDDGTITYKGVIGIASGDATKNILHSKKDEKKFGVSVWEEWKDQIKQYKKAGNPKEYVNKLKKKYGREWHPTKLRATVDVSVDVCGFIEVTVNRNKEIVNSDGGLIISGGAETVIGRTFMAGPVPVYYEIRPGVELETSVGFEFYNEETGLTFKPKFSGVEMDLPKLTVEGGVGVRNVMTAGIAGNGALKVGFLPNKGTLEFGGSVHIKVLFVADYSWNFWGTEIPLWGSENEGQQLAWILLNESDTAELSLANRDYLWNESSWNSYGVENMNYTTQPVIGTLQSGVMPDAMPKVYTLGNKQIMLFLRDVAERELGNHTQLVYSVCENGIWSAPVPVWQSNTADFFFDGEVIGDKLYVTWQRSGEMVSSSDPEELMNGIGSNSEICLAVFDAENGCFTGQRWLTANDVMDTMPTLATDGANVSVVWISNNANTVLAEEATYSIRQLLVSDDKAKEEELHATKQYILELAAGMSGGDVQVLYSAMNTEGTVDVYAIASGKHKEVKTNSNISGLSFEQSGFLWQENGAVYRYDAKKRKVQEITSEENRVVSSSFDYINNGETEAVIWYESGEETVIKAIVCENGVWSTPIVLMDGITGTVAFKDVTMLKDGRYMFVLNTASYLPDEKLDTALQVAVVEPKNDIELSLVEAETADWNTMQQELTLLVQNNGVNTVTSVNVTVFDDQAVYVDKTVEVSLAPGQSAFVTEIVNLAEMTELTEAEVRVDSGYDTIPENNVQTVALGHVDVALGVDVYEREEEMLFLFTVQNSSPYEANVALSIMEDSFDGIVLDVKNMGMVNSEEVVQYLYSVDREKIDFGESDYKTYFFQVDALETDSCAENNRMFYMVSDNTAEEVKEDGEYVEVKLIAPTSVQISEGDIHFDSTEEAPIQLHAEIGPEDSTMQYAEWSVADADIVHIDANGKVTPLRDGTTTITVFVSDGIEDSITVTVGVEPEEQEVDSDDADVTKDEFQIMEVVLIVAGVALVVLVVASIIIAIVCAVRKGKK